MTPAQTYAPLALVAFFSSALLISHRRISARLSAQLIALSVLSLAVAGFSSVLVLAVRYLSHLSWVIERIAWCKGIVGDHGSVPAVIGIPSSALALIGSFRLARFARRQRRLVRLAMPSVAVVDSPRAFAYAMPGTRASTVVSSALLDALNASEQRVVFAHEAAHHRHRHDRYLVVARAAEAVMPILRVLTSRLEFSLERWADEDATRVVGGDRRLVARTIAKVSLLADAKRTRPLLGFAGVGPAARANAVLNRRRPSAPLTAGSLAVTVLGLALSLYQLHHLEALIDTLCHW